MTPFLLSHACRMAAALLLLQLTSSVSASGSSEGTATVVIDAYPNTTMVQQGTTLILVCRVVGVPSTSAVSYQWTCPGGFCDAAGVDPEWAARIQQGNILVVNVRNNNDSGNYTCSVQNSTKQIVTTTSYMLSVANGLSLLNEAGGLSVFFPNNSFVTNTTLSRTNNPRGPVATSGRDHIVCIGNPQSTDVLWYNTNRELQGCTVPCIDCGPICQKNGAVGVDPLESDVPTKLRQIHIYTGETQYYVNQDLECRELQGFNQSAFIGVYLKNGVNTTLQPPSSITPRATSATTMELSWSNVSNATGYYVSYQRQDLGTPPVVTPQYERIAEEGTTSVTLSGLEPGTTYKIRVWSSGTLNSTSLVSSMPREMNLTTNESVPSAPRMLTETGEPTGSTIELNWLPPLHPNGAIHYEIEYEPIMTPGDTVNAGNSSSPNFTLTLPNEFVTYNVRVAAVNSNNRTISSALSVCLGRNRENGLAPPSDIWINVTGNDTAVVSWKAAQSMMCDVVIENYIVRYQLCSGTGNFTTVFSSNTSVTLHNLMPNTPYNVSVAANNSIGNTSQFITTGCSPSPSSSPSDSTSPNAVGPAVGAVAAIVLVVIAAVVITVIAVVLICFNRRRKRDPHQIYEVEPSIHPIEPPTLSNLKAQEGMSSSAECLLDGEETGAGLSTPVMQHKAIKAEVVPKHSIVVAPIPVGEFPDHVKKMHMKEKCGFSAEFKSIPVQTSESIAVGERNAIKNRYKNIFPYDFSRVVLAEPDTEGNDYINASFVTGYKKDNYYIAAQAPKPQSLVDFWQMIWEIRPPLVVMLTRTVEGNRRKSEDYYPEDIGCTVTFGSHQVRLLTKKEYVDYEVRTMELVKDGSDTSHTFDHYLFTGWPDYGVPKYPTSLIRMLYDVRDARASDVPILVHCSAGVGRTGTFIALDITLDQMKADQTVDIKGTVERMREKRMYMIQTSDQYKFVHTAVRELLLCGDTTLKAADLQTYINRMAQVDKEKNKLGFEVLFEIVNDLTEEGADAKRVTEHEDKIRYPDKAPVSGKHLYVNLPQSGSVFINASFADGYHAPKAFIAAEAPLQNTLTEFWTLVQTRKVATVVLLCPLVENSAESCHRFWPEEIATADYGRYAITLNELQIEEWDTYNLTIQEAGKTSSEVTLFHYKQWPENGRPEVVALIKLMVEVEKLHQKQQSCNSPIVVACNDGLGRTGTFIAIWSLIEQMKAEGQIDVVGTIKSIRTQRPGAVPHLDQFRFCHEAIQEYQNAFEGYANFDF